jgi:molybdate transport system substrate-binding protein
MNRYAVHEHHTLGQLEPSREVCMPVRLCVVIAALGAVLISAACTSASPPAPATAPAAAPTTAAKPAVTRPPAGATSPAVASPAVVASPAAASPSPAAAASPSAAAAAAAARPSAAATAPSPSAVAIAGQPVGPQATGEITVFAAASLTDVFNAMSQSFQQANPNAHLTFNFASSGTLVTQLSQGAKADAFAAADQNTMNNARNAGALSGQDQIFARNSLIIIVPTANPARITGLKDLANPGVKVVTADTSVPIGQYTQNMLMKASADPSYGSDFQSKFRANVVSQQTDDKQIVAQVQLGEADAAVVYATDITPSTQSQLTPFQIPGQFNTEVVYSIASTRGDNPSGGQAFVSYVLSPAGQAVLKMWNFLPPASGAIAQPTPASGGAPPPSASGGPPAAAPAPNLVASSTFAPTVQISGSLCVDGEKRRAARPGSGTAMIYLRLS